MCLYEMVKVGAEIDSQQEKMDESSHHKHKNHQHEHHESEHPRTRTTGNTQRVPPSLRFDSRGRPSRAFERRLRGSDFLRYLIQSGWGPPGSPGDGFEGRGTIPEELTSEPFMVSLYGTG